MVESFLSECYFFGAGCSDGIVWVWSDTFQVTFTAGWVYFWTVVYRIMLKVQVLSSFVQCQVKNDAMYIQLAAFDWGCFPMMVGSFFWLPMVTRCVHKSLGCLVIQRTQWLCWPFWGNHSVLCRHCLTMWDMKLIRKSGRDTDHTCSSLRCGTRCWEVANQLVQKDTQCFLYSIGL